MSPFNGRGITYDVRREDFSAAAMILLDAGIEFHVTTLAPHEPDFVAVDVHEDYEDDIAKLLGEVFFLQLCE